MLGCHDGAMNAFDIDLDRLAADGHLVLDGVLAPDACASAAGLWDSAAFRTRVVMERHAYGRGEYRYFDDPLPPLVTGLRQRLYAGLLPLARRQAPALGLDIDYPDTLEEFRSLCAAQGQSRPTCLLLRYGAGDFNNLHQDLYGEIVFPFQGAVLLSRPGVDFTGGEFVLVESRPRQQSAATVVPLQQGQMVVFATRQKIVQGRLRPYRASLRHGVSLVRSGSRTTLGIILHDAR